MPSTLTEAFELLIEARQLAPRLDAAAAALAQLPDLESERGWLAAARERLASALVAPHEELLDRVVRLPELESLRSERGKLFQAAIADELERLQAGITLAGGPRGPLLDVLFVNLKVPALRKCPRPELEKFCGEIERRLASTYAARVLSTERYQPVGPNVRALQRAIAVWRSVFVDPPPTDEEAASLRDELAGAAAVVELSLRQARLLAQAALLPAAELLDGAGAVALLVVTKGKRRGKHDPDTHPLLEQDPPDPLQPTEAERAELASENDRA